MRPHLMLGISLAAGSLLACGKKNIDGPEFCGLTYGGCNSGPGTNVPNQIMVVGFPYDKMDLVAQRGQLAVGDSVTLYQVSFPMGVWTPSTALDTLRSASWGVTDTTRARITAGSGGSGTLLAKGPGLVQLIIRDTYVANLHACSGSDCIYTTLIEIVSVPISRFSGTRR